MNAINSNLQKKVVNFMSNKTLKFIFGISKIFMSLMSVLFFLVVIICIQENDNLGFLFLFIFAMEIFSIAPFSLNAEYQKATEQKATVISSISIVFLLLISVFLCVYNNIIIGDNEGLGFFLCLAAIEVFCAVSVYLSYRYRNKTPSINLQNNMIAANIIYCSKCGKANETTSKFCFYCGENLRSADSKKGYGEVVANKAINIDGIQAEFMENRDGVNIYKAKNVSDEEAKRLTAQTNFQMAMFALSNKNIDEALKYFELSADAGNADAQHNLGTILMAGRLVPQDTAKGAKYLQLAANSGIPESQYNFGLALLNGDGVVQNVSLAIKYFEQAVKQCDANSAMMLCKLYVNEQYIERNFDKFEYWANRAIELGAGNQVGQLLEAVLNLKNETLNKNTSAKKAEIQSANPDAWKVKAFANLIKTGKIQLACGRYMMNSQPMDGLTLYDAFISVRMNLERETAEMEVPSNPVFNTLNADMRNRIISVDMHDRGYYGTNEGFYEVKMEEFYMLLLKYLNE